MKLSVNYAFPMVLSIYLIVKLENIIRQVTATNTKLCNGIHSEIKEVNRKVEEINVEIARIKIVEEILNDRKRIGTDPKNSKRN